jgi:biopolymer transport protein ExbD
MAWSIRHQGSLRAVRGLSLAQVVEGLKDETWDSTDEVLGPADRRWTAIENHPHLEQIAFDIDQARSQVVTEDDADEQRIDMNSLIDVCLVLLVFFILATTLVVMEKVLDIPRNRADIPTISPKAIDQSCIYLKAYKQDGKTIIEINQRHVPVEDLQLHLERARRETQRADLVLDATGVEWETVVSIIDAAGGAGVRRVQFLVKQTGRLEGSPSAQPPAGVNNP